MVPDFRMDIVIYHFTLRFTTYWAAFAAKNTMLRPLECIKLKPHCKRRQVARNTGTYNQVMVAMKRGPAGQPPHSAYLLSMDNIRRLFLSVVTIVSSWVMAAPPLTSTGSCPGQVDRDITCTLYLGHFTACMKPFYQCSHLVWLNQVQIDFKSFLTFLDAKDLYK